MAISKLLIIVGIIVATGVTVTVIVVPVMLTRRGKISPSNTTTTTTSAGSTTTMTEPTNATMTMKERTDTTMIIEEWTGATTTMAESAGTLTVTAITRGAQCEFATRTTYSQESNSLPSAVVAADVNGDQKPDIIIANNGQDNVRILLNTGNGMFQTEMTYSTQLYSAPRSVAVADVNGDSTLDIIVANFGLNNVGVLLNTGNGTFIRQTTYSTGIDSTPYSVATADVNGDNKLDIIVANFGMNNVGVLLNTGSGTFATQTIYSTGNGSYPKSVTTADVNGDNKSDIIVANSGANNVSIFLNMGDGTFMNQTTYSTGLYSTPCFVTTADVNGDNHFDIIVANTGMNNVGVLFNMGNGTFTSQITYPTDSGPLSVTMADVNGDNQLDIIVANFYANDVSVLFNRGNGMFSNQTTYSMGLNSGPQSVATADVNGDNKLDIIISNRLINNVNVLINMDNGTFTEQMSYSTSSTVLPYSVVTADVNGDNKLDIIVSNSGADNVGVLLNTGNGIFTSQTAYWTGNASAPYSAVAADVNGDNILDIIVANHGTDNVGVLLNKGNGMFANQIIYSTGLDSGPQSVVTIDVNGDNELDMIVANSGTDNVGVFLNVRNGSFTSQKNYSTGNGSSPYSVAAADINGDNKPDIVVANFGTNNVGVLLNMGDGTFSEQNTYSTGSNSNPSFVVAVDVNGDNKPDIIVANSGADNVGVFLNTNNGIFSSQTMYSTGVDSSPSSFTIIDMNGDRKLDIVVANFVTDNVNVLLNMGNGTFMNETTYSIGSHTSPQSVAVADIDGDSKLDIIVASYGANNVKLLVSMVNGTFSSQTTYSTGIESEPYSAVAADVNGDNKLDIIVTNQAANNIGVLLNTGNGIFTSERTYSTGSHSGTTSTITADVNGDNKLDMIAANFGTNNIGVFINEGDGTFSSQTTYSTGSASSPISVTTADVNGDGMLDIIVANYGSNNIGVFLNTGNGMFNSQTTYSTGTLSAPYSVVAGDINGDNKPDIIVSNVYAWNVGIFFNMGDGTFNFQITYPTGYESYPTFAMAADVNGDSQLDIVVAMSVAGYVGVLLNIGNSTFGDFMIYSAGAFYYPCSLTTADVNGDNKLDIIAGDCSSGNIGILVNIGNGRFTDETRYSTEITSYYGAQSVAMGDVNGDNKLDIIVASPYGNYVDVFFSC